MMSMTMGPSIQLCWIRKQKIWVPERDTIPARSADREVDECSSVRSETCWGEKEDIADVEVPEWGVLPPPTSAQAVPAPRVVNCDRVADLVEHQGRKRLRLINTVSVRRLKFHH